MHSLQEKSLNFVYIAHSKKNNDGSSTLYNVQGLGFNTRSKNFLYTAGGDGCLIYWDVKQKNKIYSNQFDAPLTASAINSAGTVIAFGLGYDWAEGVWGLQKVSYTPRVGFRIIRDNELSYSP